MLQKALPNFFINSKEMQESIGYLFAKDGNEKYLQFFGMVTELFKSQQNEEIECMNYTDLKTKLLQMKNEM